MTTATGIPGLTPKSESQGKTYYEPIIRLCKGSSKYNDKKDAEQHQFYFDQLDGYWTIGRNTAPVVGNWYSLELSTKPADKGMYQDIVRLEPTSGTAPEPDGGDGPFPVGVQSDVDFPPERPNGPDWDAIQAAKDQRIQSHADAKEQAINLASATRDAMIFIQMGVWPIPEGRTGTSWLRECRARLYYNVHAREMEPRYWCYEHNEGRNPGSNGFGHPVDGGSCIWLRGVVLDAEEAN